MDNSFSQLVDSSASILVILPVKPRFDEVAAGLSLYLSIHDKKEVAISCPTDINVGMNRLVGINKVTKELGNKNLTIVFAGYDAANIDKVSYDIEQGEFKLTVAPKAGLAAPTKEQIALTYQGISADLVVLIGGSDDSQFPILGSEQLAGAKFAHVGIRSLTSSHEVMSFAKPASSISELAANMIKESGMSLDTDSATNLVMGIEEGSSNFASSEVTPETFETFAYLLRNGGQRMPRVKLSPANFPPGAIPSKPFTSQVQPAVQPQEADVHDIEGTQESEVDINPPDDWLQPKVFKGADINPDSFSENKG